MNELEAVKGLKSISRPNLTPVPKIDAVLVVLLDASGSMIERMDTGESKLHAAWRTFVDVLADKLQDWHLGIIAFGGIEDVDWVLTPTSQAQLRSLQEPAPGSVTPMLPALQEAWRWLKRRAEKGRIILISDGLPNHGGSPDEVLEEAPKHGVIIDTIGCPSSRTLSYSREFLETLSRITGGQFREIHNAGELATSIEKLSPKERPLLGRPK